MLLLFILILEALSHEFCTGVPWELLYADDLAVIADTLEECVSKLKIWICWFVDSKSLRLYWSRKRAWRTKAWVSTWRRLSSWSLDLVLMFSVTLVHFHMLAVGTVLDRQTQSCARNANFAPPPPTHSNSNCFQRAWIEAFKFYQEYKRYRRQMKHDL